MDARTRQFGLAGFMRQAFLWALLPALVLVLGAPSVGDAQVVTNITSTTGAGNLGTTVTQVGNSYNITGGTRPGSGPNLFHSFGDFSVGAGDVGNFLNTPVNGSLPVTSNILSRVTGGNISNIYGTIRTTDFPGANLFLMNPAGVLFGPSAALDLGAVTGSAVRQPGSFYATTADYLNLVDANGTSPFYADPAQTSVLSVAPVVAFGFLGPNAASIAIQGGNLEVPDGKTLSFIGGPRVFTPDTGVTVPSGVTMTAGRLSAPNGLIYMETVTAPGEIPLPTLSGNPLGSPVSFPGSENAVIYVQSGELVMKGASLLTATTGPTSGEPIDIDVEVAGKFTMQNASALSSSTTGEGQAGAINVSASTLAMDASSITTETSGDGSGGNLTADVGALSLTNFAAINSNNFSFGLGQGGNVTVQGLAGTGSAADSVTLNNGATLTTQTFGPGKSGDVQISAASIGLDGAAINTFTFGPGRGGDVELNAGTLTMENVSLIVTQTLFGGGVGGDVVLNVGTGSLLGGSSILSQTLNFTPEGGQGGKVIIQGLQGVGSAAESVTLSGGSSLLTQTFAGTGGGQVVVTSKSLTMDGAGTTIISSAIDVGRGGDVVVNVQQASLSDGATFISQVGTTDPTAQPGPTLTVRGLQGTGSMADSVVLSGGGSGIISTTAGSVRAGDIAVHSKTVTLADGAVIQGGALANTGAAGNVTIEADSVDISGGSNIVSQASNSDAGQITITANTFTLDNGSITTQTTSGGRGGDVVLDVASASLTNGASINTSTLSPDVNFAGNAGTVTIRGLASSPANSITITNSSVTTSTLGAGQGGAITMEAAAINLNNGTISANTSGTGSAGSITANFGTLTLTNGSQISSASTGVVVTNFDGTTEVPGRAGNVTITATGGFTSDASSIATSAEANHGGDIAITAQNVQLSNGTKIDASSNAPLQVTKLVLKMNENGDPVLDDNGNPVLDKVPVGDGNAGNITINSASNVVMQNSSVTTDASLASGGQIEITAPGMVRLIDSKISTSVAGSDVDTTGGDITIDPQFVILQNSQIIAQAFAGSGGAIDITAGVFMADPASILSVSSTLGVSGTINIQSPVQNIGGRLTPLSQQFSSAAALLAQRCAARVVDGKFSTFVVAGREGLPVEPGGFLSSPSLTAELLGASLSELYPHTPTAAITALFPEYDARPIQLAKFGDACR